MSFNKEKYDELLAKGLMDGLGDEGGTCIEGAVALALGEHLNAFPRCVARELSRIGIQINDYHWESNASRADAMYKFGLAQLGTRNPANDTTINIAEFTKKLKDYIISKYIVDLVHRVFSDKEDIMKLVDNTFTGNVTDWLATFVEKVRNDFALDVVTRVHFKSLYRSFADGMYTDFLHNTQGIVSHRVPDSKLSKEYYPRLLLQLAMDALRDVGHSNEFDSIWKA